MNLDSAESIARQLMDAHGLNMWAFEYTNDLRVFGRCIYRTRTIELSVPLTRRNDESEVRNTILHEIAHALTPGDGHGERWKEACVKIGARPIRCYSINEVITPDNYYATCLCPGVVFKRIRRTRRTLQCSKCRKALIWDTQEPSQK